MTPKEFAYWLQGFYEVADPVGLSVVQVELIKNKLKMVFADDIEPKQIADHPATTDNHHEPTMRGRRRALSPRENDSDIEVFC